jgi:hypothetical protein
MKQLFLALLLSISAGADSPADLDWNQWSAGGDVNSVE